MEAMHRWLAPLLLSTLALGCHGGHATAPTPPAAPAADGGGGGGGGGGGRPHYTDFQLDDGHLRLPGPIVFAAGTADLDVDASAPALWFIHDYLEAKDYITLVRIEGHDPAAGEDALMMTGDRALAVGRWLVGEGIACDRLLAAAFGNFKPVADGSTAAGQAQNRRIEVVNAALRGIAIGGMPVDGSAPASAPVCD